MAAPATSWPATTASAVLSGKGAKGASVGETYIERLRVAQQSGTTIYFFASTQATGWNETFPHVSVVYSFTYRMPLWVRSGAVLRLSARVLTGGGFGTAHFRFLQNGGTTGSDETTSSGSYVVLTSELTVPDGTWAGANIDLDVEAYVTAGGTVFVSARELMCNLRLGD